MSHVFVVHIFEFFSSFSSLFSPHFYLLLFFFFALFTFLPIRFFSSSLTRTPATSDHFGRVFLVDALTSTIVRVWKGYR